MGLGSKYLRWSRKDVVESDITWEALVMYHERVLAMAKAESDAIDEARSKGDADR